MTGVGSKRKASDLAETRASDASLRHVTDALDNFTRTGATAASGSTTKLPFPGLAIHGDANELHFPLGDDDKRKLKARAAAQIQNVWEIDGAMLEVRNPRWSAFLSECIAPMRENLGIASTADVKTILRKMVLVEAGGRLNVGRDGKRGNGVFGSLVVALPGAFEGGDVVIQQARDEETETSTTWKPSARENLYDVTYAALYDHTMLAVDPVADGAAVFLVYDLATTTPGEVPHFGGQTAVQELVNTVLTHYFKRRPDVKRRKIGSDSRSQKAEEASERLFVQVVSGKSFEDLDTDEAKIAKSLEAFCVQSDGQYVLYIANVSLRGENAALKEPWLKHGESIASLYPVVALQVGDEVAMRRVKVIPDQNAMSYKNKDRVDTQALVVMPASFENEQRAKMPLPGVVERLRQLLPVSRDAALLYMQSTLDHCANWKTNNERFQDFVQIVIELNDFDVFKKMLLGIKEYEFAEDALSPAVNHFGWAKCWPTLTDVLGSVGTASRVASISLILDASTDAKEINKAFGELFKLDPWTITNKFSNPISLFFYGSMPSERAFGKLLELAQAVSPKTLNKLVNVTNIEFLSRTVVPALDWVVRKGNRELWIPVARSVRKLMDKTLHTVDMEMYKRIVLPKCCAKCDKLQAFLVSNKKDTQVKLTRAEFVHLRDVTRRHLDKEPEIVTVESVGGDQSEFKKYSRLDDGRYHDEITCYKRHADRILGNLLSGGATRATATLWIFVSHQIRSSGVQYSRIITRLQPLTSRHSSHNSTVNDGAKRTRQAQGERYRVATAADGAGLRRVTVALENVTRVGATFASGATAKLPFPGLARAGDADDLRFRLGRDDATKLKAVQCSPRAPQCGEVNHTELQVRNPRWPAFLSECIEAMREGLGIAPTAVIPTSLRKLALAEAGGQLGIACERERGHGVFGSLVMTLPSAFKGGNVVIQKPCGGKSKMIWKPSARDADYDVTYAVLYDSAERKIAPVTSRMAVFLVYDLATTTPSEVPLFSGPTVVQESVNEALATFFSQSHEVKRRKIYKDALWKSVEYASQRVFVHTVSGMSFEDLGDDEVTIARSLAAFCAQSEGQYALYHTDVLFSGELDAGNMLKGTMDMTLKAPWLKHGDSVALEYPPVAVQLADEVVMAEDIKLFKMSRCHEDPINVDIVSKLYKSDKGVRLFDTYALVAMPVSFENEQRAKLPLPEVVEQLRQFVLVSRDAALLCMQCVLDHCAEWKTNARDFQDFVQIVIELNDFAMFKKMLLGIKEYTFTRDALRPGVNHFGWGSCRQTFQGVIRAADVPSLFAFAASIVDVSTDTKEIDQMFAELFKLLPWTAKEEIFRVCLCCVHCTPEPKDYGRLLQLARVASPTTLKRAVTVTNVEFLSCVTVPALEWIAREEERTPWIPVARAVRELLSKTLDEVDNELYNAVVLPKCCNNCDELQAFLVSKKMEAKIHAAASQVAHLNAAMKRKLEAPARVTVEDEYDGTATLNKWSHLDHNEYFEVTNPRDVAVKTLERLLGE